MNNLIPKNKIIDYVTAFNNLKVQLENISINIFNMKENLTKILSSSYFKITDFYDKKKFDDKKQWELKKEFWQQIFNELEYRQYLTLKEQGEFDKSFYDSKYDFKDTLPEFTEANIWSTLQNININELMSKLIKEMLDILKPRYQDNYKTNTKVPVINSKIILKDIFEWNNQFSNLNISHYHEDKLNIIQKIFWLFDGKGIPRYPNILTSDIKFYLRDKYNKGIDGNFIDEYFDVKLHKKGTAHITFLRLDLLEKINEQIFKNTLGV